MSFHKKVQGESTRHVFKFFNFGAKDRKMERSSGINQVDPAKPQCLHRKPETFSQEIHYNINKTSCFPIEPGYIHNLLVAESL